MWPKAEVLRKSFIGIAIMVFTIVVLINLADKLTVLNANLFSDLSNLVIALYTGFIAVFFTILAIHMSMQYGLNSVRVLVNKSAGIFVIYSIAVFISVLGLIFSSQTAALFPLTINTSFVIFTTSFPSIILGLEMAITVLSAYIFPKYLQEALQITPLEIMKNIGFSKDISELCKRKKFDAVNDSIKGGLSHRYLYYRFNCER